MVFTLCFMELGCKRCLQSLNSLNILFHSLLDWIVSEEKLNVILCLFLNTQLFFPGFFQEFIFGFLYFEDHTPRCSFWAFVLVFSQLSGTVVRWLTSVWENSQSLLFRTFLLSVSHLKLCWPCQSFLNKSMGCWFNELVLKEDFWLQYRIYSVTGDLATHWIN